MKTSRGPLIVAIALLLLPILYVGSYFALVSPKPVDATVPTGTPLVLRHYRVAPSLAEWVFWPLEQIDRQIRPNAWNEHWLRQTLPSPNYVRDDIVSFAESPGVAKSESVLPGEPTIVHLRNWHWVKKVDFAKNTGLAGDELDREYDKAMKSAADVHASLKLILADVEEVYVEGLTDQNQMLRAVQNGGGGE